MMSSLRLSVFLAILVLTTASVLCVIPMQGLYVAGICLLAFLPSLIIALGWLSHEDFMNPLAGVWLSLFFGMGLRAAYMAVWHSDRVDSLMWKLTFSDLAVGAIIASIGSAAILIGYGIAGSVRAGRSASGDMIRFNQERLFWVTLVLGSLAIIVAADFFRRTGFDLSGAISAKRRVATDATGVQGFESLGYHRWAASIVPSMLFYFWYWESFKSRTMLSQVMAWLCFLFTAGFAFLASSRSTICILLLNSSYIAHCCGALRVRHFLFAGAGAVAVLSTMLILRQMGRQAEHVQLADMTRLEGVAESVLGSENFSDLGGLTRIYRAVPDLIRYKYGLSYVTWLFAPIPRSIWSDKPVISQGLEVTEAIYNARRFATGIEGGGRPPGFLGEVIMNFGVWGVPVCGLLYGMLLRMFQNYHETNRKVNVLISVFICVPLSFELMSGEFSRTVLKILMGVVPAVFTLYLAAQRFQAYTYAEEE